MEEVVVIRLAWLEERIAAASQLRLDDFPALAAAGVTVVVNHRPDGEEPGQPRSADLAAIAADLGLIYVAIPIRCMPDAAALSATAEVLEATAGDGRFVFFCRSGLRSVVAWAGARRLMGAEPDDLKARAAHAGYDLSCMPL